MKGREEKRREEKRGEEKRREEKGQEHDLGTERWYDVAVSIEFGTQFEASLAIVAYFGPQEPPFWTTLGALGGHSAQYLAHVGYSVVLHR